MFNIGLIDSLKMRIKLDEIKVIDKRLISEFIKYYPAEDLIDEQVNNAEPYVLQHNGITYRYYIKSFINQQKYAVDYLVVQVSAKMLKERYFEGITKKNYHFILNDINAQKVVEISDRAFLDALVSDIDICINQLIDQKSLQSAFTLIQQFPKPSCKPLIHLFQNLNKQGHIINLGLDFNKREKATNTRPYCKIYHKGIELMTKSLTFYNAYLTPQKSSFIDNLVRYEFTIKAYKHKKYLNEQTLLESELKTFNDLINIKPLELTNIAKSGLPHYLEKKQQKKPITGLNPIDTMIAHFVQELISKGSDLDDIKKVLYNYDCPVTKSRIKAKLKDIMEHLNDEKPTLQNQLKHNEIVNKFLSKIGY